MLGFAGAASTVAYQVTDAYGQTGTAFYTPTVTAPAPPSPADLTSTGVGTAVQSAGIVVPTGGSATLLDATGIPVTSVVVTGKGAFQLNGSTLSFAPVLGFAGTGTPAGYRVTDAYGQHGTAIYTPTVTPPAAPSPPDRTSSGVGTAAQSVTISVPPSGSATLLSGGAPANGTVSVPGQGSYSLSGNTITFVPVLGFAGAATPVFHRLTDAYGQSGDARYSPTVTAPPGPNATSLTSTGTGIAAQTVTVALPAHAAVTLLDANGDPATEVTTPAGTYALTGADITFTPVIGFAGSPVPVDFRITDAYGQTADGIYQPTVSMPGGPQASDLSSSGVGTTTQAVAVTAPDGGAVRLLDTGAPVTTRVIAGKGTFGTTAAGLTFEPVLGWTGSVSTGFRISDVYGQHSDATYTATVTPPPPPVAPDRATQGVGITPQAALLPVPAGGTIALLDANGDPATTVVLAGKGTYRLTLVDADTAGLVTAAANSSPARITFVPVLGHKGPAPAVQYVVTDPYGQTATASYVPTVTLPPLPPPPPKQSIGAGTDPQHVTLPVPAGGSVALLDQDGEPVTTLTVAGQGTYTLDPATGALVFTPVPGFTGKPDPITYQITDAYGQVAAATYAPAVIGGSDRTRSPSLPATGAPVSTLVLAALILIAAGAAATRFRRAVGSARPGPDS